MGKDQRRRGVSQSGVTTIARTADAPNVLTAGKIRKRESYRHAPSRDEGKGSRRLSRLQTIPTKKEAVLGFTKKSRSNWDDDDHDDAARH